MVISGHKKDLVVKVKQRTKVEEAKKKAFSDFDKFARELGHMEEEFKKVKTKLKEFKKAFRGSLEGNESCKASIQ